MNGNTHKPHDCPYCWRVLYSKGALTNHMNNEHWKELLEESGHQHTFTRDIDAYSSSCECGLTRSELEVIDVSA